MQGVTVNSQLRRKDRLGEKRSSPTISGSSAKGGAPGGKTSFENRVPQEGLLIEP